MDDTDDTDRLKLVRRLFALLTAWLEDSAQIALEGQTPQACAMANARANELIERLEGAVTIAMAAAALVEVDDGPAQNATAHLG
jgi:hypothetical protein